MMKMIYFRDFFREKKLSDKACLNIFLIFVVISSMLFSLAGCKKSDADIEDTSGLYDIYYMDADGYCIEAEKYQVQSGKDDIEGLYNEILSALGKPQDKLKHRGFDLPEIIILNHVISNETLDMYFAESYNQLPKDMEILFRAAFVKTMTQIDGIKYVSFYVNGQPMTDVYGNSVGIMLASDFIEAISSQNYNSWVDLSIYYALDGTDKLEAEKITVGYGKNVSVERVIIEQLIKGPEEENHRRTVSSQLTLLNATTKDGTCYLNFDLNLADNLATVTPAQTIYSIVNSLCGLSTVNKVQISINSDNKIMFREKIDLSQPFERNLDIIQE